MCYPLCKPYYKIHEEQASAFTWEGILLDAENIAGIADVFVSEQLVREGTDEIAGYTWTGKE